MGKIIVDETWGAKVIESHFPANPLLLLLFRAHSLLVTSVSSFFPLCFLFTLPGFTMKNLDFDADKGIILFSLSSSLLVFNSSSFFSPFLQFWRRISFPISLTQMGKPNTLTFLSVTFILLSHIPSLFLLCSSTNSKTLDMR